MRAAIFALLRAAATFLGLLLLWWGFVQLANLPTYLLPGPWTVLLALSEHWPLLWQGTLTTLAELLSGLLLGTTIGGLAALLLMLSRPMQRWLMPVLVLSQALPVFALAPLLVLWFGFGMASKIVMATLVIFFPVTAASFDGLRSADPGWIDLARTMDASPVAILWRVRLPAALPAFGSGLRVATAVAPIGAILGEWVGSAAGLGHIMMNANARMDTELMFAALFVLALIAILLYVAVDRALRWLIYWAPDTNMQR